MGLNIEEAQHQLKSSTTKIVVTEAQTMELDLEEV